MKNGVQTGHIKTTMTALPARAGWRRIWRRVGLACFDPETVQSAVSWTHFKSVLKRIYLCKMRKVRALL